MAHVVELTLTMQMRGCGFGLALWEDEEVVETVVSMIEESDPRFEVLMAAIKRKAPVADAPGGNPPGRWGLVDGRVDVFRRLARKKGEQHASDSDR